jgi:hypothetical protein
MHGKTAFAGICQHLLAEVGCTHGGFLDAFEKSSQFRVGRRDAHLRKVGITENCGKQVIEIVGDSARQNAKALKFLGIEQFSLKSLAMLFFLANLSDIRPEADGAGDAAVFEHGISLPGNQSFLKVFGGEVRFKKTR